MSKITALSRNIAATQIPQVPGVDFFSGPADVLVYLERGWWRLTPRSRACYRLEEGDSITLDRSVPHQCVNVGDTTAKLVSSLYPATF